MKKIVEKAKKVAIVTHVNADPDALSSACALHELVHSLNKEASIEVLVPEGIGSECKYIYVTCQKMNIKMDVIKKYHQIEDRAPCDVCIVLDTASLEQLRLLKNYVLKCDTIIIIDHHQFQDIGPLIKDRQVIYIGDGQSYSSTAEIVFEMLMKYNLSLNNIREIAEILLAGVLWDTKRFQRITRNTFHVVASMIDYGANYEEALKLIATERPSSNRIARIKCIFRHRGFKVRIKNSDIFIAISNVGAYESDCASTLITIGYDISFVITEDESLKAIRIVYRGREDVINSLNIDIYNEFVKKLIEVFGGGGGGHKAAGGAILRTYNIKQVVDQIIKILNSISEIGILEFVENKT